jgi:hypothetical protein
VVVDDFDVVRIPGSPTEADTPLLVDPNAVLTSPAAAEPLKPVSRWTSEVIEGLGRIQHEQLSVSGPLKGRRKALVAHTAEDLLGRLALE